MLTIEQLSTNSALTVAAIVNGALVIITYPFVMIFGNWFILFRRFGNRFFLWAGAMGSLFSLATFFWAQSEPSIAALFFGPWIKGRTGADWVVPALFFYVRWMLTLFFAVGVIEWLITKGKYERAVEVADQARKFFLFERLALVALIVIAAPAFFILARSSIYSLDLLDRSVLPKYVFLWDKTLDAVTVGFADSFGLQFISANRSEVGFSSAEIWLYILLISVVILKVAGEVARAAWVARST